MKPVEFERLVELRMAAEVGMRMVVPCATVHVKPEELASICEELHVLRGERDIDRAEIVRLDAANASLRAEREQLLVQLQGEQRSRSELRIELDKAKAAKAEIAEAFRG